MTDDVYARIKSKKDRHALRAKDYIAEASLFICAHESEKKRADLVGKFNINLNLILMAEK